MKQWLKIGTSLLLAAIASVAIAQSPISEYSMTTEGAGTLRLGSSSNVLKRGTLKLEKNGKAQVVVYGSTSWSFSGTWKQQPKGVIELSFTSGPTNSSRGAGKAYLDNKNRLYKLEGNGAGGSVYTFSYTSKDIGPWVDERPDRPDNWTGTNATASGEGSLTMEGRKRTLKTARVIIRTDGDAEISLTGDNTTVFRGKAYGRDGNTVHVTIDEGPNKETNARGDITFRDGKVHRIEIDGRDRSGSFVARFQAGLLGGGNPNNPSQNDEFAINEAKNGGGTVRIGNSIYDLTRAYVEFKKGGSAEMKIFAGTREYAFKGRWQNSNNGWDFTATEGMGSTATTGSFRVSKRGSSFTSISGTGRSGQGERVEIDFRTDVTSGPSGTTSWAPSNQRKDGEGTLKSPAVATENLDSASVTVRADGTFSVTVYGSRGWSFAGTWRKTDANSADLNITSGFSSGAGRGTGRLIYKDGVLHRVELDVDNKGTDYKIRFQAD